MKVKDITAWLENKYPASMAEEWDNVGLLVGDDQRDAQNIFLALDLTDETLDEAISEKADLIVTHHPMIFSGMKKINNHDFIGRKVIKLIRNDIACYAMHTNYDILGMADLCADYLKLKDREVLTVTAETPEGTEGLGRIGKLPRKMTLRECGEFVKTALSLNDVKIYGDLDTAVEIAANCTGSGKSLLPDVFAKGADVYITGDIDHHTGIDAVAQGLCIIDAGHYGTEYIFMDAMKKVLHKQFPEIKISAAKVKIPYTVL